MQILFQKRKSALGRPAAPVKRVCGAQKYLQKSAVVKGKGSDKAMPGGTD
jgi:hypothetical protein